jgi:hypothetical protein
LVTCSRFLYARTSVRSEKNARPRLALGIRLILTFLFGSVSDGPEVALNWLFPLPYNPTPMLLTPLTREVVAGGCCRYIRSTSSAGARRLIRYHHAQRCPTLARASQPELSSCTRHGQARRYRVPCTTKWCPPGLGLAELQAAEQCLHQDGGWGECKASATVRLVCSG